LSGQKRGKLVINTHPDAESIDAHCGRCGAKVNRKYRQHKKLSNHPQGRPCGALLCWLFLECPGEAGRHKESYNAEELSLEARMNARVIGEADPNLAHVFRKERDPRSAEVDTLGEPVLLP
jgi:hypothetical protein